MVSKCDFPGCDFTADGKLSLTSDGMLEIRKDLCTKHWHYIVSAFDRYEERK